MTGAAYIQAGMPVLDEALAKTYKEIRAQALTHTVRGKQGRVLDSARPNRPDSIRKYVSANARNITTGEFRMLLMKLSRLLKGNDLNYQARGEKLTAWIEDKPFYVNGEPRTIWDWLFERVLPFALRDPNGLLVAIPYHNGNIPPAADVAEGGIPDAILPKVRLELVSSAKIRYRGSDMTVVEWFKVDVGTEYRREVPTYLVFTTNAIEILVPFVEETAIKYRSEPWWMNTGGICAHALPGYRVEDPETEIEYLESFAHSFFEYGDEFVSMFADNQAVRVQHFYPKYIVDSIACPTCSGQGQVSVKTGGTIKASKCDSCMGTGNITAIDPYAILQRKESLMDDKAATTKPIDVLLPAIDAIKVGYDLTFDILLKGKHSMGLELAGRENESAEAKKLRMEDLDDMMQTIATLMMVTVVSSLESVERLLEFSEEGRKGVTFTVPGTFIIQTPASINEDFKTTHHSVRQMVFENLVEAKTNGDETLKGIYRLAVKICPEILLTEDEIKSRMAAGTMDRYRMFMVGRIVQAVTQVWHSQEAPYMEENDTYTAPILALIREWYAELSPEE